MAFKNGSGGNSGGGSWCSKDNGDDDSHGARKNYNRHTPEQIQRLEFFYKECPHPDENQRCHLGVELGMEPRKIKFWFQNKRTQTKAQNERADNDALRSENDRIRCENTAIHESLKNVICPSCGGPPSGEEEKKKALQKLREENAELKLEYERIASILAKFMGRPLAEVLQDPSLTGQGSGSSCFRVNSLIGNFSSDDLGLAYQNKANPEIGKSLMAEIAASAMDELIKLLKVDQYMLDRDSYDKIIPQSSGPRYLKSRMEYSKDSGVVSMNAKLVVDLYLDPEKWADLFPNIVSKARTIHVLEAGLLGSRSGSLQLMYEQLHIISPLVQPREFHVLRYCQQIETGKWVIVDVSCDYLSGNTHVSPTYCWKYPSGCMIQELPNGHTKVTYTEHIEVDDNFEVHPAYEDLVKSALGFGATKWILTLQRTCERYSYLIEAVKPGRELGGGTRSMIMLACRMVKSYCSIFSVLGTSYFHQLSELTNNRVEVAVHKNSGPGQPVGIVISAFTAFRVPASTQRVFKYLSDHVMRSQWDVLCHGNPVCEVMQIPTGSLSENRISVLELLNPVENIMIFQESMVDQLGSLLVYAPIDSLNMGELINGTDSTTIPILASGFAVTTDGQGANHGAPPSSSISDSGGSLVTVAFQILASSPSSTEALDMDMMSTIDAFVDLTVRVIKSAFGFSA